MSWDFFLAAFKFYFRLTCKYNIHFQVASTFVVVVVGFTLLFKHVLFLAKTRKHSTVFHHRDAMSYCLWTVIFSRVFRFISVALNWIWAFIVQFFFHVKLLEKCSFWWKVSGKGNVCYPEAVSVQDKPPVLGEESFIFSWVGNCVQVVAYKKACMQPYWISW